MEERMAALEAQLDSFDRARRDEALDELLKLVKKGSIALPAPRPVVNLHAHSFYSYNALGYSPTHIVWRAKREGLQAVGLVDFDVLDGLDEFFRAGELLGIATVGGMETRAYVPEFSTREINSPGEPGITYHMVSGLTRSSIDDVEASEFARELRTSARRRNMDVVERVNAALAPVVLDYEHEVLPLSPSGTPTERHLCEAYQAKAEAVFPKVADRVAFWSKHLSTPAEKLGPIIDNGRELQALIRSKTMKRGGVGYQEPKPETFPLASDVNQFGLALGGIPMLTWLDSTSSGEAAIEELIELHVSQGVAAVNIIPDRNWNIKDAATKELKVRKLYEFVEQADRRGLPIGVGTEMNAPGLKFVDSFDAPELAPVVASFLRGSDILAGHTAAVLAGEDGYTSDRIAAKFPKVEDRNAHFLRRGRTWRR
jgi:hypothetical protein